MFTCFSKVAPVRKDAPTDNVGVRRMGKSVDQVTFARIVKSWTGSAPGMQHEVTLEVEHELLLDSKTIAGYNEELISDCQNVVQIMDDETNPSVFHHPLQSIALNNFGADWSPNGSLLSTNICPFQHMPNRG